MKIDPNKRRKLKNEGSSNSDLIVNNEYGI